MFNKKTGLKVTVFAVICSLLIMIMPFQSASAAKADGTYSVSYTVINPDSGSASIANDYFVKPASVTVSGGKFTVQLTIKNSSWITEFKPNGASASIISTNPGADTRVVRFNADLTSPVMTQMKVDIADINYHHEYTVRLAFDISGIPEEQPKTESSSPTAATTSNNSSTTNKSNTTTNSVDSSSKSNTTASSAANSSTNTTSKSNVDSTQNEKNSATKTEDAKTQPVEDETTASEEGIKEESVTSEKDETEADKEVTQKDTTDSQTASAEVKGSNNIGIITYVIIGVLLLVAVAIFVVRKYKLKKQ